MTFFFFDGRDSNPGHCIYYAMFIPTELNSRGQISDDLYMLTKVLWKKFIQAEYLERDIDNYLLIYNYNDNDHKECKNSVVYFMRKSL